jgi:hypothetical protein
MTKHRNPRQRLSKPIPHDNLTPDLPDVDDTLHATQDALWTADANITAAERMLGEGAGGIEATDEDGEHGDDYGHGGDGDPGRLRNHLLEFVESAKAAVRAAQYAHSRTVATLEGHRRKA